MNYALRSCSVFLGELALLLALGTASLLTGCATTRAPSHPSGIPDRSPAVVSVQKETLPKELVERMLHPQDITYHLGPGDVVAVNVYLHPDLSVPPPAVAASGPPGAVVSNNGNVQLPLLGIVHVAGMTVSQLHGHLTQAYGRYLRHPYISVQVQEPHSIRYYLLGEFTNPGLKYSDRPLQLLEAMTLAGSVKLDTADLRGAYVVQDGRKLPIDFYRLLVEGNLQENARLATGDTIVVPSTAAMRAFVFGAVGKPGPVTFVNGRLTLLQALSEAGMDVTSLTNAQLSNIHVIRSYGDRGEYIVVDAEKILRGQALPFVLQSGDIVYVPQTGISHFNQILAQLLPSLQTVSALLNPFVQIKFLRQ